jgi:group I intron endonuclease
MSKLLNYVYDVSLLDNLTKLGIYKISHINKPDAFYIGSASGNRKVKDCQKGFYRRFLEHLHFLEHKSHNSRYLQNVVNKYGIEGIRFEILEIVETEDRNIILEREQYYLDSLNPTYNSSKTARCPTVAYTAERKKATSIRMKGKKLPATVYNDIRVPVYQFDKQGKFLKKYNSIQEASDKTKTDRASISNSASGKRKSAGGYLWSYNSAILIEHKPLIYQYTLEDHFVKTFDTLEEIKKEFSINTSTAIRNCFSGKQKQAYGFKWIKK